MAGQGREINLGTLPLEQLNQLKDQLESETQELTLRRFSRVLGAVSIQRSGSEGGRTPYCLRRFTSPRRLTWDTVRGRGILAGG